MDNENFYLTWIKKNSKLLSVSALEQFIGVPAMTLQYVIQGTREFPAVHLPKLEKLRPLIRPDHAPDPKVPQGSPSGLGDTPPLPGK